MINNPRSTSSIHLLEVNQTNKYIPLTGTTHMHLAHDVCSVLMHVASYHLLFLHVAHALEHDDHDAGHTACQNGNGHQITARPPGCLWPGDEQPFVPVRRCHHQKTHLVLATACSSRRRSTSLHSDVQTRCGIGASRALHPKVHLLRSDRRKRSARAPKTRGGP